MTSTNQMRILKLAAGIAVGLHMALFILIRPAEGDGLKGLPVAPQTHYLAKASNTLPINETDARVIWSPLLFSQPSEMGFSRELLRENLQTRLTISRPAESECFLDPIPSSALNSPKKLLAQSQTITPLRLPPDLTPSTPAQPPSARRVYVAPELRERLAGKIVLPAALNKEVKTPWEIHAEISISKEGTIRHVFLDRPLKPAALNQSVIQLLHGLRFKPGAEPIEGSVEIYSPKVAPTGEVKK